jgi:pimeloyl-ACP methyl ester carboxylesterase
MPSHTVKVRVDGVALVVKVWPGREPTRPPAVLLPGTGATAEDWDLVASSLSSSRTVYAVNLRGHGSSDWPGDYSIQLLADDVAGLLGELDDRPVDLVGHSLGGLVACKVAVACPELTLRLVLEDVGVPHPRPAAPPARPQGMLAFDWGVVEQVRPEIDYPDPQWGSIMSGISAPTLVIGGGPRSLVPQENLAELVQLLPDGRLVTIDTGHLVHATKPDDFIHHVLDFLDSIPPRSPGQRHDDG